ncbi:MAG: helix-turn-helix transcriptional regulator [Proteobacteria bacterium]|nr:helix-turn-helix transcriptional regulator [Pseudomonadota bacterium]
MGAGSYGYDFGRRFGDEAADAPALVSGALRKTEIAVTYLRQETPTFALSEPQPREDALLLSMGFQDFLDYQLWEDDRPVPTAPIQAPQITLYDLRAAPYIYVNNAMVGLHFHLPRSAFDNLADDSGVPRIGELNYPHGWGIDDPVIFHLGQAILPAFRDPRAASRLFVDHVTLAVCSHVARAYGGMRNEGPARGGLAPWQARRATEMLAAQLDGEVSHVEIARACGLSPGHFARAFRATTGAPPHRWLLNRRVDKAKSLLRETAQPLSDIAGACGFADQSHFTRTFTRMVGVPPGTWRRTVRS